MYYYKIESALVFVEYYLHQSNYLKRTEMATNEPMQAAINEFAYFDRVATQILDTFEPLIRQLTARRDALLRELQDMKEKYLTKESNRKAARDELLATQQHLQELSLKVNENKQYHEQATDVYGERIRQLDTPIKLPLPFLSCPILNRLTTAIAEFGEVKECKLDYSLKKEPVLAVGKRGSNDNELMCATGLALDEVNQLIYIVDWRNSRIQVVSFEGKFLKRFGQDILKQPWGVSVTEDNIFVTDTNLHALLQFRKKDCKLVRRTGTFASGEGQLDLPSGLCSDYNGDVYVADPRNNRVSVFSKQLEFMKCLGTQQLKSPVDVKVTPNSVVILDWSPNCIHFYSRSGDLLSSCVTQGEDGMMCNPSFFCLDTAGNILITDNERNDVKILSPSGHLIHKIGKEGHGRGEFRYPRGICVTEFGIIFVISWNSNFALQSF